MSDRNSRFEAGVCIIRNFQEVDMIADRHTVFDLFLASALGLFVELVFIRWVGSELRIFGLGRSWAASSSILRWQSVSAACIYWRWPSMPYRRFRFSCAAKELLRKSRLEDKRL